MKNRVFLDSNIFLYALSSQNDRKHTIAQKLVLNGGFISTQVINEVSVNLLKKFKLPNEDIENFVNSCYKRYEVINLDRATFLNAVKLRDRYNFSYFDSLIVSASLMSNFNILYSEDMQNSLIVENRLVIKNPFFL